MAVGATPEGSETLMGAVLHGLPKHMSGPTLVPSPSWPLLLLPQAYAFPSEPMA